MADLDADLQTGNVNAAPSSEFELEARLDFDADLVRPEMGRWSEGSSFCTCEGSTPTIHTVGITAFEDHLDVEFSAVPVLSGPALEVANWYVTIDGPGREVTVGSIEIVGNVVRLGVTPQTLNGDYTLHLPTIGITTALFGLFTGLYSLDFLGVPTPVTAQMIKVIDTHTIDVIFGIAVDPDDASDPTNYTLDNGLTVVSATRITDFWYRLRNEPRQVDATTYDLIISNIGPL